METCLHERNIPSHQHFPMLSNYRNPETHKKTTLQVEHRFTFSLPHHKYNPTSMQPVEPHETKSRKRQCVFQSLIPLA